MHMRSGIIGLVMVLALGAAGCGRGASSSGGDETVVAIPIQSQLPPDVATALTTLEQTLAFTEERVRHDPGDCTSYVRLGRAHIRLARATGDFRGYARAEAAFRKALELNPQHIPARAQMAVVLSAHHRFAEALELAEQLRKLVPEEPSIQLLIADAHLELGHYAEVEKIYQPLRGKGATAPVLARLARLEELQGRPNEALNLLEQAARNAAELGEFPDGQAWYYLRQGDLHWQGGQGKEAARCYTQALKLLDGYPPALAGLGRVQVALGKLPEALELYRKAVIRSHELPLFAELGDLYAATGNDFLARLNYDKVEQAAKDQPAYYRELALFYANHDRNLPEALDLARKDLALRQDIFGHDALAWCLYKNGKYEEAAAAMAEALKLGTQDAVLFYHAGMIHHRLGHREKARDYLERVQKRNPHFALRQAEEARRTLAELQGATP